MRVWDASDVRVEDDVVVTGLGAVSSLGMGVGALWDALQHGRDGLRPVARFSTQEFTVHVGGLVPGFDAAAASDDNPATSLCTVFAVRAAREAWQDAGLPAHIDGQARARIALVLGTSSGDKVEMPHRLTASIGTALDINGPRVMVSTACSSSTGAIGLACDLLQMGVADIVLAGGVDVLTPEIFAGFHALGLLSPQGCAPFGLPEGTTMAEGAGVLVLERARSAAGRGARCHARILGYGLSADAYHPSTPDPTGAGVARALNAALLHAGITADQIDYVNAHGTGTATNDPAEWRALCRVFGGRSAQVPVTSLKGHLGHAQGSAGVLELIGSVAGLREGVIPPTLHFSRPRLNGPTDVVHGDTPRPRAHQVVACCNSAFGGHNAAVILAAPAPDVPSTRTQTRRQVWVTGAAAVGAFGLDVGVLSAALRNRAPVAGRVPTLHIEKLCPGVDPRGLDPTATYLLAACAAALGDARVTLRGPLRDRSGLFVGVTRLSPQSADAYERSIQERGLPRLAANLIPHMVFNAAAGMCAQRLGLRGPNSAVATGYGGGLFAILYAAQWLAGRSDTELLLAGGVDEQRVSTADPQQSFGEGAGCLLLSTAADPGAVQLAGWGLCGPAQLRDSVEMALRPGGLQIADVDAIYDAGPASRTASVRGNQGRPSTQQRGQLSVAAQYRFDHSTPSG